MSNRREGDNETAAYAPEVAADYIAVFATQLAKIADAAKLGDLAIELRRVAEEAQRAVETSARNTDLT